LQAGKHLPKAINRSEPRQCLTKPNLRDRGEVAGEGDERTLVDLLVEQIEFADVVVLNKVGSASLEQRELARKIIASLNAEARIIEADYGRVPLGAVLNTGLFDFERAQTHPLWFKELNGFKEHVSETEEYGIRSFVYRARRPFAPVAFNAFVNKPWPGVVRAKGCVSAWNKYSMQKHRPGVDRST
jgi:G3E family GTPase